MTATRRPGGKSTLGTVAASHLGGKYRIPVGMELVAEP